MPRLTSRGMRDERVIAEECPVALVFDGTTMAVLMATPSDLTDLALGFSLTEGIIEDAGEIEDLSVVPSVDGIELRTWLRPRAGRLLKDRRRRLVGPTGCGLCGIESLAEANRMRRTVVRQISLTPDHIRASIERLGAAQILNRATRATHAAGFFRPGHDDMILREDVGRHNALDKLAGALATEGVLGRTGAVVLTSRISVEMVQKAAAMDAGFIIAISAPTALAIRTAEANGITLIGIARGEEYEVFSHFGGIA
ncbi:formate dehydrogenase accessory sulfurtransferase FdhD [Bradyrhizobium diazoefficiens]|nr:formate dehydrogenase accessory sulfurtransferase FdhD [Bradyrhizobium diazoefficiens]